MKWVEAKEKIRKSLKVDGISIDKKSRFRDVRNINDIGFRIGKGKGANQTVLVTWDMLENIYKVSSNKGFYNNLVYQEIYEKPSTSCLIHIIGHIFCVSDIMYTSTTSCRLGCCGGE